MAPPRPSRSRPRPAAGTDAAAPDTSAAVTGRRPPSPSDRGGRPFWAHLDSPFTVGLLLTLGGLVALAARDRAHQHRRRHHLHRPRDVRRAGPGPGDQVVRAAQRQAPVGDRDRLPDLRRHRRRPPVARRADPDRPDQPRSSPASPTTITNFENTDSYAWLEGIFGPGLTHARHELGEVHHQSREHRGDRRAACSRSAPESPPPSRARSSSSC